MASNLSSVFGPFSNAVARPSNGNMSEIVAGPFNATPYAMSASAAPASSGSPTASAFSYSPFASTFKTPASVAASNYAGSLSMTPISMSKGSDGSWKQTGGFNFDLPMSTIAAFQNNALGFTAQNSDINKGFLSNVISNQTNSLNGVANMASGLTNTAINAGTAIAFNNAEVARTVSNNALQYSLAAQDAETKRTQAQSSAAASSGGCFFTTAVCEHWNLPDDCEILNTMRAFRDNVMLIDPKLSPFVAEYYEKAPAIVAKIDAMPNASAIWEYVGIMFILPGVKLCEIGANKMALYTYREMCKYLDKLTGV